MERFSSKFISKQAFCDLARTRTREAAALLDAGGFSGAYYLGGYAIECALKAVIAAQFGGAAIPERRFVDSIHVHEPARLIVVAGLDKDLEKAQNERPDFEINWIAVKAWNEKSRYRIWSEDEARTLYAAITAEPDGVMPWLMRFW